MSQGSAGNLIRIIWHQILRVCADIYSLLEVKGYWPLMLHPFQVHLDHLHSKRALMGAYLRVWA